MRRGEIVLLLLLSLPGTGLPAHSLVPRDGGPPLVLWAWERPEDLRTIDPRTTGVAYLALSISLDDQGVRAVPRRQPLRVPDGVWLSAVTRIEAAPGVAPSPDERRRIVDAIGRHTPLGRVAAVQIDFDAVASQRPFYRALIEDLGAALPRDTRLSITALASWCLADRWLAGLPIDEAVPMAFRIGAGEREIVRRAAAAGRFHEPLCAGALGVSADEPLPRYPHGRRLYVFSPRAWRDADLAHVVREVEP